MFVIYYIVTADRRKTIKTRILLPSIKFNLNKKMLSSHQEEKAFFQFSVMQSIENIFMQSFFN